MSYIREREGGATGRLATIWRLPRSGDAKLGQAKVWLGMHWSALAFGAIVLPAGLLRLYALDYQSLWSDEIFSLIVTDPALTFCEFWDRVLADTHPPLYYLILRLWSSAFGQSEIAARVPSAVFGILTLCAAAALPGSAVSKSARLMLPLLFAAAPGVAWYDREARSYALLILLSTVITLAFLRFLHSPPNELRKARAAVIRLTGAAILASFTHYFGFLLAVAAFSTCFVLTTRDRRPVVAFAGCGVLCAFVPWVIYHSKFVDARLAGWIASFSVSASLDWFNYLSFGGTASAALFAGTTIMRLAMNDRRRFRGWNSPVWPCTLLFLLTLSAAAMISVHVPILTSRNLAVTLPALYVIVAELTASLVRQWSAAVGAIYFAAQLGLMGQPVAAYYTMPMKEQWRESADLVLQTPGCETDAIHVYGEADYYYFFTKSVRPKLSLIEIPEGGSKDLSGEPVGPCPILLWVVGRSRNADDLRVRFGLSDSSFGIADFYEAFVVFRNPPYT
jgi:uncharacterized membrane protein